MQVKWKDVCLFYYKDWIDKISTHSLHPHPHPHPLSHTQFDCFRWEIINTLEYLNFQYIKPTSEHHCQ